MLEMEHKIDSLSHTWGEIFIASSVHSDICCVHFSCIIVTFVTFWNLYHPVLFASVWRSIVHLLNSESKYIIVFLIGNNYFNLHLASQQDYLNNQWNNYNNDNDNTIKCRNNMNSEKSEFQMGFELASLHYLAQWLDQGG